MAEITAIAKKIVGNVEQVLGLGQTAAHHAGGADAAGFLEGRIQLRDPLADAPLCRSTACAVRWRHGSTGTGAGCGRECRLSWADMIGAVWRSVKRD